MDVINIHGSRGSISAPRVDADIRTKNAHLLHKFVEECRATGMVGDADDFLKRQEFWETSTFGGNTSCVEVILGGKRFVFDMGTGARLLGNSLIREMFEKGGITFTILLSHTHWDHIQGFPFCGPLFVNKNETPAGIKNYVDIYGGTNYMEDIEACLKGQMEHQVFPVTWEYLKHINHHLLTHPIGDMERIPVDDVNLFTRMLNHPGGSLGYRMEHKGKVIAYTTDNEPFDRTTPHPPLLQLASGADYWITDCQYLWEVYTGELGGVCRMGWGHSYPLAVATTAKLANVKHVVLFHHDPASSDERIAQIENQVRLELEKINASHIRVSAAYDGMQLIL